MIVGIGVETKGYRVYLPKDRKVVTTQHVKNIETLDRTQNEQIQRLYLEEDDLDDEEEPAREQARSAEAGDIGEAPVASDRVKNGKKRSKKSKKKKTWTRERPVTRSVGRTGAAEAAPAAQQEEDTRDVVNNVVEVDPKNYGQATRSAHKESWLEVIAEELEDLEANGV
ncbi:hypothetical protein PC116_g24222 [Phytophthora cactorum]|uniref:Retroviral polymerase SH3-like domain-containing protein n=1 Tax=Phytophthora cactorum TaxID=29920 RepID=A0A329S6M8_9STRA|nr:hypothetical protein Pcac1_g4298 [Phytophthora cactorum]KAG2840403.1 hypothetical protein PC113_g19267 [Phytophthora cactorum]KAG4227387.1 hypothetical protein PC116_g24222 [Phytophthora cactorum]RAW32411.1 hypothetical protein PC110_g11236 [Phytophthora cactorum]